MKKLSVLALSCLLLLPSYPLLRAVHRLFAD